MATASYPIENAARDFLNVGIGLFNLVATRIDSLQKDIVSGYTGLVTRGAADKSEIAEKLRSGLEQGVTVVRGIQVKTGLKAEPIAVKPVKKSGK